MGNGCATYKTAKRSTVVSRIRRPAATVKLRLWELGHADARSWVSSTLDADGDCVGFSGGRRLRVYGSERRERDARVDNFRRLLPGSLV